MNVGTNDFFREIEKALPPVVSRVEASKITGGLISAKTLSNEDALRKGPKGKIRIGAKVGYTRDAFMDYLRRKFRQCPKNAF
jgi:hypothetical protein